MLFDSMQRDDCDVVVPSQSVRLSPLSGSD